jgi:N-acetylneuraminate lyase
MNNIAHIKGLVAAPFTPLSSDGSLNLDVIPNYYELLKSNGIAGAFICGSTGEGVSLSVKEKKEVAEAWIACAGDDKDFKVITLVGGNCVKESKTLAEHASNIGLDAIAYTAPSYFKTANAQVLADICMEIAAASPVLPFYYYHIPVLTGVNISMFDLLTIIHNKVPNFAGIKYTHEDFMDYLSCLHFADGRYDMLWGRDENMLAAMAVGAKGAVGSTFNYIAPVYHNLMSAFHKGDLHAARLWQQKSIDLITLLGKYGGIATGKAYMKLLGLDCGQFRLPVSNMTKERFRDFALEAAENGFHDCKSALKKTVEIT